MSLTIGALVVMGLGALGQALKENKGAVNDFLKENKGAIKSATPAIHEMARELGKKVEHAQYKDF